MKHLFLFLALAGGLISNATTGIFPASAQESPEGPLDTTAPSIPANLAVTVLSSSALNLSWTASTDAIGVTGYKVYRRSSGSGIDELIATVGAVTTYENTGLAAGIKFWYSVSAIDAAGNESGKSVLRSGRTLAENTPLDTTAPSIPANLAVTVLSSSALNLSWTASTDAIGVTGYKVYRRSSGSGIDELIATVGAVTTYENTGLAAGIKFWYSVSAIDAAGNESGKSVLRSGRTLAENTPLDTTAPSIPANLAVTVLSSSALNLSWTASTDAIGVTGYKVYRRSSGSGIDELIATVGAVTTYENTGLAAGIKFWYSVSAIDAAGNESGKSVLRSGRTADLGDATLPTGKLGPEISVGIFNYVPKDLKDAAFKIEADRPFSIMHRDGEKVTDITAGKSIRVKYLGDKRFRVYDPDTDTTYTETSKEVRFEADDTNAVFDVSRPGSSFDRYRGDIRLRFYDSPEADGDRIWVINTLPIEHYVYGMGEITGTGPDEYDKVMTTIFRTYGYWKLKWSTKYADQGFKVDATSGNQIYYGYDWEITHPDIPKAADATRGTLVMYEREVALTPYSSWTDGKTRRFEDGHWGRACTSTTGKISETYPWLSSVSDPEGKHPTESTCSLASTGNHMVGLSANGAVRLARYSNWGWDTILRNYYTGIRLVDAY